MDTKSPKKNAFSKIKSSLDNKQDRSLLIRENKDLKKVPNFIKLNSNLKKKGQIVEITEDTARKLVTKNSSLLKFTNS